MISDMILTSRHYFDTVPLYMGGEEREILAYNSWGREEGEGISLELAERLRPLGRSLPSEIPLEALTRKFNRVYTRREKQAMLGILTPDAFIQLMAWREETAQLTESETRVLSQAILIAKSKLDDTYAQGVQAPVTLGRLREEPFDRLRYRSPMGDVRAALLKEIFGNSPRRQGQPPTPPKPPTSPPRG